eukprot:NODE_317_length_9977_cov_0.461126.p4 type:complete len:280 gc:universal NODE_317_length_9977_cov_0.461126:1144-1983(+)
MEISLSSVWPSPICFPLIERVEDKEESNFLNCILWYHYDKRRSFAILPELNNENQNKAHIYMYQQDEEIEEMSDIKVDIDSAVENINIPQLDSIFQKFIANSWNFTGMQYTLYTGCHLIILYFYSDRMKMQHIYESLVKFFKFKSVWKSFEDLVYYSRYLCEDNIEWVYKLEKRHYDFAMIVKAYNENIYPPGNELVLSNYVQSFQIQNITEKKKILLPCLKGNAIMKAATLLELFKIYQFDKIGPKIEKQFLQICNDHSLYFLLDVFKNNLHNKIKLL